MVSMQDFKSYPGPGETSILEKDGRLCSLPVSEMNIAAFEHPVIALYPDINISRELCQFSGPRPPPTPTSATADAPLSPRAHPYSPTTIASPSVSITGRSPLGARRVTIAPGSHRTTMLRAVNEPLIKRCSRIFFEDGLVAALQEAATADTASATDTAETQQQQLTPAAAAADNRLLRAIARNALHIIALLGRAQLYVQPQQRLTSVAQNAVRLSQTRDWSRSLIRAMAWHPHTMRLAVAACDDSVRIYTDRAVPMVVGGRGGPGGSPVVAPTLKAHAQRSVTAMQWRPFSAGQLAVAGQLGVVLWNWDPSSLSSRPLQQPALLRHENHSPVTSLAWSGDGRLLATASCADPHVQLWDVDQLRRVALRRVGAPCALLSWSPDDRSMFTSTVGSVFRVWSTHDWTPERWTVPHGAVQSAAWSPCGGYLLFVTTDDECIYSLSFVEEQLFANSSTPKAALPVVDLQRITVGCNECGGRAQSLVWDASGQRLAVSFKETAAVAIFLTSVSRTRLSIVPDCLLVGLGAEVPQYLAFQPRYKGKPDTVLAIGWSTGRVQFFPFM